MFFAKFREKYVTIIWIGLNLLQVEPKGADAYFCIQSARFLVFAGMGCGIRRHNPEDRDLY